MTKDIIIIGNSQLAFFVAKWLEREVGDLAHVSITWLTTTDRLFPAAHDPFKPRDFLGIKILKTAVKSVNLNDQRVVTGQKTLHYDLLFVDQTPVFTGAEIDRITDQFETLLATVRSKENRGQAAKVRVALSGKSAATYQLALTLVARSSRDSSSAVTAVRIEVEGAHNPKLKDFFADNTVFTRSSQHPGLTIKEPLTVFPSKKIRGLQVDLSGRPILLLTGEPTRHQNAIFVDSDERASQNLGRSDYQLARRIAGNLVAKLEGGLERPLETGGEKLILVGQTSAYMEIGRVCSNGNRSRAVAALERAFWRRLLTR